MSDTLRFPEPSLIVLVGASASGKSTWAAEQFRPNEIVSSDALRAVVGSGERDLSASDEAFALLEQIVETRVRKRLTTVIDTLGFDEERRRRWLDVARRFGIHAAVVVFDTPAGECRSRNSARAEPLPGRVIDQQLKRFRELRSALVAEGFDRVITPVPVRMVAPHFVPPTQERPSPTQPVSEKRATTMTFGLQISVFSFPGGAARMASALTALATETEKAGFDALYVMDHFRQIPQLGRAWDDMPECFTTLAFLAGATQRIRLGSLVAAVGHRSVAALAKTVATLDVMSAGRAICGLGLGWFDAEQRAVGVDVLPVNARYELLEDALRALPLFWGPGTPPFAGDRLNVPEAMCYPRPLQARIPILLGGSGARRTLRLAAQYADACNIFGQPSEVARSVEVLRQHCVEVGRDPSAVDVTHLSTIRIGDPASARRGRGITVNVGTLDDHRIRFAALRAAGVRHAIVSFDRLGDDVSAISTLAPLIAEFA